MAKKIKKIGIIGISEGNGHPYSWSAIFNGYDQEFMKNCPFSAIPEYLGQQDFPKDGLKELGSVTHIWTQNRLISEKIAKASHIPNVVDDLEDLIGKVDAVLLARDDAENHYEMALPFLKVGLPIFIDKPLALTQKQAEKIFAAQEYQNQIFTCSSIRFANEIQLNQEDRSEIGEIVHVEASVPKKWDTYAVHIIEPLISQLPDRGKLLNLESLVKNDIHQVMIEWKNISAYLKVTGTTPVPIKFDFYGKNGNVQKIFKDSFSCFKSSLEKFIRVIEGVEENISREETMEIVRIIEKGKK